MKMLLGMFFVSLTTWLLAENPPTPYRWYSGETEERIYLSSDWIGKLESDSRVVLKRVSDPGVKRLLKSGKLPRQWAAGHTLIFTATPQGGPKMALVGNFSVFLDSDWQESRVQEFFRKQGWKVIQHLPVTGNAYLIESAPGLPSLQAANSARLLAGVEAAEPVWWKEVAKK